MKATSLGNPKVNDATAKITKRFRDKGNHAAEAVAKMARGDDAVLKAVLQAVDSTEKRIKNAAGKTLKLVSIAAPGKLYPELAFFTGLLAGEDRILKWLSTDIIGNLAAVDTDKRFNRRLLAKIIDLLADETMITVAHAVEALGVIAQHKPQMRQDIAKALLADDKTTRHAECHNILAGKRIEAFGRFAQLLDNHEAVISFAKGQLKNPRNATKKKAEAFLKKHAG